MDDNGHGTHCAGTIGAVANNGQGVAGVMWEVRIMPLKFMSATGSGYTSDAVAAILYANRNGASVISNSWGGSGSSTTLKNAIDSSSALVVCAAGNDAKNTDSSPFYPASYTSPQVLAVAASTATDTLASFSNYGTKSVDVAAPGEYIYSTVPGNKYGYKSGTSMATPHVAGLAGLIEAYQPGITYSEVKGAILDSVDKKTSLQGKVLTSGRVNARNVLDSLRAAGLSVTSILPVSATNTGPVTVTVSGSGFLPRPSVALVAGTTSVPASPVTYVSAKELRCSFDITGLTPGSYNLAVSNPDGSSVTVPRCFEVLTPPPPSPPLITGLAPSSATAGGAAFTLTVEGCHFTKDSKVCWNGVACNETVFGDATRLSIQIPASFIAEPGTVSVTVADPLTGTSNAKTFTITAGLTPSVTRISPSTARMGTTRPYTIYGSNLVSGASASLVKSGTTIQCDNEVVVNSGRMTTTITVPSSAERGYWDLVVTNPGGKSGTKSRVLSVY